MLVLTEELCRGKLRLRMINERKKVEIEKFQFIYNVIMIKATVSKCGEVKTKSHNDQKFCTS